MLTAKKSIDQLREGNVRFVRGLQRSHLYENRRKELASGQAPFAVILCCADSRVPPEIIFDQGLGDLFVVRVAGNVVNPDLIGSVEYAVSNLSTRLVVVLGHSCCGAVAATVDELQAPGKNVSPNVASIVESIRPSVEPLLETEIRDDREKLIEEAVRNNVQASVQQLVSRSTILENGINHQDLLVVGAEYSLETGEVDFFCDGPALA